MTLQKRILDKMNDERSSWTSTDMSKALGVSHEEVKAEVLSMAANGQVNALDYGGIINFGIIHKGS